TITDGQAVGTILNDDPVPALRDRSVTPLVAEGSVATLTGTMVLAAPGDAFALEVSWGDNTPTETFTFPPGSDGHVVGVTHRYRDDGVYPVHAAWHNQFGGGNSADFSVTVRNVAPVVDAGGNEALGHNGVLTRTGSFHDPGADSFVALVDYGDGDGPEP